MTSGKSRSLTLQGSRAAACAAVLVLSVVAASAAIIVQPLLAAAPAGTEVAPSDTAGINLLEPTPVVDSIEKTLKPGNVDSVERVVGEWTPTGGGGGGGGGSGSGKLG